MEYSMSETLFENKTVVILSGVSGSGKSTLIQKMTDKNHTGYAVVSADDYWIRGDGQYDFNFRLLGNAHAWCKVNFDCVINDEWGYHVVFVDNTNLTLEECRYYIAGGLAAGYDVLIVDMITDLTAEQLAERNVHSVPLP